MSEGSQIIVVTGCSKGIGRAVCEFFLARGDSNVVGISRSKVSLGDNFTHIQGDLYTQEPQTRLLQVLAAFGEHAEIHMVHNFGHMRNAHLLECDEENWRLSQLANLEVPFRLTREVSPLMSPGSSHVYIGSTLATMAVPDSVAYVATKHGLVGLMKAVAIDLANRRIRSNMICPGFVETDMADGVIAHSASKAGISPEEQKQQLKQLTPLGRFVTAAEIASWVATLVDRNSINGELIHVNGGFGLT